MVGVHQKGAAVIYRPPPAAMETDSCAKFSLRMSMESTLNHLPHELNNIYFRLCSTL